MGHERVGRLPKTKKWQRIVGQIANSAQAGFDVSDIAKQTVFNVRQRFRNLQQDDATRTAFTFLVELAVHANNPEALHGFIYSYPHGQGKISPLRVARALQEQTSHCGGKPEYVAIAEGAAADAIALWYETNRPVQDSLFKSFESAPNVWHKASSGSGFCELSRLFFSKVVERYLGYFLYREAAQALSSVEASGRFRESIESYVADISRHAFETSKITQSYAAGWFNKYAVDRIPTDPEIDSFISYAFGKLQDELMREEKPT